MTDPIDKAIASSEAPQGMSMAEVPVLINSTGRPAIIGVPEDITDAEVMELTAWMLRSLRGHIQANLTPASRIQVVRGSLPQ